MTSVGLPQREHREGAAHEVVCDLCFAHIPCSCPADAPRAYQEHRRNGCPEVPPDEGSTTGPGQPPQPPDDD